MRWTWPFKSRNGNHRNGHHGNGHNGNGHNLNGVAGDARPDFLCVGAQKAGTSWLYRQLEPHPDFWMPPVKELHYLDNLNRTKRHRPPRSKDERDACFLESIRDLSMRSHIDLDNYGRLFCHKGPLLSGDISPAYSTLSDEIIERVVGHFPNMKVVFLARDPVERAWSQLSMGVRLGMINKFDATDPEEVICNLLNPGVLVRSHPSKIVARWKRYVRPENFRIYFFDVGKDRSAERNFADASRAMIAPPFKSTATTSSSDSDAWSNDSVSVPLRETHFATLPLRIFNCGFPFTVTGSLKTSTIRPLVTRSC